MLSRVADHIYWMSRYIERAENIARFVDVNLHLMLDLEMAAHQQWEPMVSITGDHKWFTEKYGEANQENVLRFLTLDRDYPHSILTCLYQARENARSIREVISSEMWEHVNDFYHSVTGPRAASRLLYQPHDFFTQVKTNSHLFNGLGSGTFSHGEGWNFGRLGQFLERADKTSRILDVKYFILLPKMEYVGTAYDNAQWAAVLQSASALEMYRMRFHLITPAHVAEFLLFDRDFPRSIQYCLNQALNSLHKITGTPPGTHSNPAERLLGRLLAELNYSDIGEIFQMGLHDFLDNFQAKLNTVGDGIFNTFFALRPVPEKILMGENRQ
jgi:uncharacterized alpha-E superfamily protein